MSATTVSAPPAPAATVHPAADEMSHKQILEAMTGLLAGLFTALLSSTIVSTALPTIIGDLNGTQHQYTWVITASLLATTVSTPIWGKFSDLFSKKLLVQLSLVIFVIGSIGAGLSQSVGFLIACRVVQGLGMGGLTALTQSIMGAIIAPRQRGRYSGYMGAVMAVSTVSGPLLGGVIVDSSLGWRWTFFVCIPLAVIALFILQATLHVPTIKRNPKIDYLGAVLIAITASLPLLWITFAGNDFPWWSLQTAYFLVGTAVALALTLVVESRAKEPMVPLKVLKNRTAGLVVLASAAVGIAMFGGTTFLTQYFQISRGYTPTKAGLLTIPLMAALLVSSTGAGQIISRTGRWKKFIVGGSFFLVAGLAWLGTIDHLTPMWHIGLAMALMGFGLGAMMQNLVLAVQNTVDVRDVGAASATIAFFRTLGGAVGVSALGAVLATQVTGDIRDGLAKLGPQAAAAGGSSSGTLNLKEMPAPVAQIVRAAYGDATGHIFLIAAVVSVVALVAVLFIKEVPLRTTVSMGDEAAVAATTGTGAPALTEALEADTGTDADALVDTDADTEAGRVVDAESDRGDVADRGVEGAPRSGTTRVDRHGDPVSADRRTEVRAERALASELPSDSHELTALAALDVLTSAQDEVRGRVDAGDEAITAARDLLLGLGRDVDAALGQFHTGLESVIRQLEAPAAGRHSQQRAADVLHDLEFTLLRSTQAAADRVVAAAHAEAEAIVARARLEAGRTSELANGLAARADRS
ncbi:MDR family MFS transporter [Phycicoccus sp. Root101]|uniref:MDR family MFS transporter n=1 Tax=Phycicoccus sp. Root101 TaxID=1736421 RepID=UPI000AA273FE|nr:MDR family MFS transporter [Phycicoccus sp. Root101]